jgi:lipid-A-disaccharide synthase
VQIIAAVAPTAPRDAVAAAFPGARLLDGLDYDAAQLADAAAVASGTATLELALLGVPMVVAYRCPLLTELQYLLLSRVLRRVGPVALPNLIAGRPVVPELLQRRASPAAVADYLAALLADSDRSAAMRRDLAHVAHALGSPGALERTARLALSLIAP